MTLARIATGVTAASIMIFVLNQDVTAQELPAYGDVSCQQDGAYQHCTATMDDGSSTEYWWRHDPVTDCTVFWINDRPGKGKRLEYCPKKPYRAR